MTLSPKQTIASAVGPFLGRRRSCIGPPSQLQVGAFSAHQSAFLLAAGRSTWARFEGPLWASCRGCPSWALLRAVPAHQASTLEPGRSTLAFRGRRLTIRGSAAVGIHDYANSTLKKGDFSTKKSPSFKKGLESADGLRPAGPGLLKAPSVHTTPGQQRRRQIFSTSISIFPISFLPQYTLRRLRRSPASGGRRRRRFL